MHVIMTTISNIGHALLAFWYGSIRCIQTDGVIHVERACKLVLLGAVHLLDDTALQVCRNCVLTIHLFLEDKLISE